MNILRTLISIFFLWIIGLNSYGQNLVQIGETIIDETSGNAFGEAIALSNDGSTMVVGQPQDNPSGAVSIYKLSDGNWQQMGQKIIGESSGDQFGWSVDIEASGTRIVIGAVFHNNSPLSSGAVYIYDFNSTTEQWELQKAIYGEYSSSYIGYSVAISDDGRSIVTGSFIGTVQGGPSYTYPGTATVYEYENNDWIFKQIFFGNQEFEGYGYSVAISGDGNTFAAGAPGFLGGHLNTKGRVEIFSKNNGTWYSFGNIDDTITNVPVLDIGDAFGSSVAIDYSGNYIVIGSKFYSSGTINKIGLASAFKRSSNSTLLIGNFYGTSTGENFGQSVSISSDGLRLGVSGTVKSQIFESNEGPYLQVFNDLAHDNRGSSIAFNEDGSIIASSDFNYTSSPNNDVIKVYKELNGSINLFTSYPEQVNVSSTDLSGIMFSTGGEQIEQRGVLVKIDPIINTNQSVDFFRGDEGVTDLISTDNTNEFNATLNNLLEGRTYLIRAYVTHGGGNISYGNIVRFCTPIVTEESMPFTSFGSNIGTSYTQFDSVVELNADGTLMVVGSPNSSNITGKVSIFKLVDSNWVQLGESINGESTSEGFGHSVSLNADGTLLAIGSPYFNSNTGRIKIFSIDRTNNTWSLEKTITGFTLGGYFGYSIAINDQGTRLATGALRDPGPGSQTLNAGTVYVYDFISNDWTLNGAMIGENLNEGFGYSIGLSGEGNHLAIGAPGIPGGPTHTVSGRVEVHEYSSTTNSWNKLNSELTGLPTLSTNDFYGISVELNYNGSILASSATYTNASSNVSGFVSIHHFNNNSWNLIGEPIYGEAAGYIDVGVDLSLSANGQRIIIGGYEPFISYEYNTTSNIWSKINTSNVPEGILEDSRSTAISQGGSIVAVGYPSHNTLQTYKIESTTTGVITTYPSEIKSETAILGALILPMEGVSTVESGIIYTDQTAEFPSFLDFEINDEGVSQQTASISNNSFISTISGLSENTKYAYRAYIKDDQNNYIYGDILMFTTVEKEELNPGLRLLLQGPYDTEMDLMKDDLRVNGLLPTTSPYPDQVTADQSAFDDTGNLPDNVVDWVYVELRDKNDISSIIYGKSALLTRIGNLVNTDRTPFTISGDPDDYYISISHRNHLSIATDRTINISSNTQGNDLSSDTSKIRGGTNAVIQLEEGVFGMISGDSDNNNQIQIPDLTVLQQQLGTSGYSAYDLDLNGQIQNTDIFNIILENLGKGIQF